MTRHRGLQVLVAVREALRGRTSAGDQVSIGRIQRTGQELSIDIAFGDDAPRDPDDANIAYLDSDLEVFVDLYVKQGTFQGNPEGVPDYIEALWKLRAEVHERLMQDPTLGFSWLHDLEPDGADAPRTDNESQHARLHLRTRWRAVYRSSYADPTQ